MNGWQIAGLAAFGWVGLSVLATIAWYRAARLWQPE